MATTKPRPVKGEAKVRDYLLFVADPQSIVKEAEVAKAQRALERNNDPLKALDLFEALRIAKTPDGTKLEAAFIAVAKDFAEAKGYTADHFLAQGVDREVLRAAGFQTRAGRYKARVTGAEVREHIMGIKGQFTINDVVVATNASEAGARNTIGEMVEDGSLTVHEPVKDGTPGKPSRHYEVK